MAVKIHRKEAVGMEEIVRQYIQSMKLSTGLNTQRVFAAWDACERLPLHGRSFYRG